MIWPVSSYFLAWALTVFPKKHLEVEVISATEEYYKDTQFGSASTSAAQCLSTV